MTTEELKSAPRKIVGLKQTLKAVETGVARVVYIARDADERLTKGLREKCAERGVEVVMVPSMAELGRLCGIEVGAAAAARPRE